MSFELLDPEPKNLCEVCVLCYFADPCWLRPEITTTLSQHSSGLPWVEEQETSGFFLQR